LNERQAALVRALVDRNSADLLQFEPAQANVLPGVSGSGQEVDADLQELADEGWVEGDRETVGDLIVWSHIRVRVAALQQLHDWPPPGMEHERGIWTRMVWGKWDLKLLKGLEQNPPPGRFLFRPVSGEAPERFADWNGYLRLYEAGLISGVMQEDGLDQVRIMGSGNAAIGAPDE
jgi:hypothetical protein